MTLQEIYNKLNEIAMRQPNVNQVIKTGNVYDLNSDRKADFRVFCATQATHTDNLEEGVTTYNFFLYVIDRMKDNGDNKITAQSSAIETLRNIIRVFLKETDCDVATVSYEVFTQSFSESCCGAYATVGIIAEDNPCIE